jgi:hypothetical protein
MFRRRKEDPSSGEAPVQNRWQRALWDGEAPGWAKIMEGEEFSDHDWAFSAELPENTDPESIKLGFSSDAERQENFYTVSYKLLNLGLWELLMVSERSKSGDFLSSFSAHLPGELEKDVGFNNMDLHSKNEPLTL